MQSFISSFIHYLLCFYLQTLTNMTHLPPPSSPEPPEPPSVYCTPSPQSKATTPSPQSKATSIFMSRQQSSLKPSSLTKFISRQPSTTAGPFPFPVPPPEYPYEHITTKTTHRIFLRRHRHTNPAIWCSAIICMIFTLLIIFFGLATLILFLVIKPKTPVLDTNHASLNVIYFDAPGHFNGDLTLIANFSNPNKKLDVSFEHAVMELYFENNLIATQSIRPFSQRRKETGVVAIRFISSLVYLPPNQSKELQRQVLSNKVLYTVRGTFRVRASLGSIHFSYWLHGWCELQMGSPPSGSLMARTCKSKTKR